MTCQVVISEQATGIVLHADGSRWHRSQPAPFQIFDDVDVAVSFAVDHRTRNPGHECIITDENGRELRAFR